MSGRQALAFVVLLVAVVASGIQVALVSQRVRQLYGELEAAQKTQDRDLAEYSRLLLERSARSAYQKVERLAADELHMKFPEHVEPIE